MDGRSRLARRCSWTQRGWSKPGSSDFMRPEPDLSQGQGEPSSSVVRSEPSSLVGRSKPSSSKGRSEPSLSDLPTPKRAWFSGLDAAQATLLARIGPNAAEVNLARRT
eukprot:1179927-Pleurochrysis_carterae.AAC.1